MQADKVLQPSNIVLNKFLFNVRFLPLKFALFLGGLLSASGLRYFETEKCHLQLLVEGEKIKLESEMTSLVQVKC